MSYNPSRIISFIGLFIFIASIPFQSFATRNIGPETGLPIPRFVTIKTNKANIRTGPSKRYPIKWVFNQRNVPVKVLAEFEGWRKVRDMDNEEGWVHQSLLSGRRHVIVTGDKNLLAYRSATSTSVPVFRIEPGAFAHVVECTEDWCRVAANDLKGWIRRNRIWGLLPNETLKK